MAETSVLLPFESLHFSGAFKDYFSDKRKAFFNSIEAFPQIWSGFQLLDGLWTRSLGHLTSPSDQKRVIPVLLFFNAHARIRIAFELGFSRCLPEAFGTLRSAVESTAYAFQFVRTPCGFPKLPAAATMHDEDQKRNRLNREIKQQFKRRKEKLFEPEAVLGDLHKVKIMCDQRGSHLTFETMAARASRSVSSQTAADSQLNFLYSDAPKASTQSVLSLLLDCGYQMHVVLYKSFESRLKLDQQLPRLCGEFRQVRDAVFAQLQAMGKQTSR